MKKLLPLLCFTVLLFGCQPAERNTIRFAVTDIEGLEQLQIDFGPFKEALEEATGKEFEFFPVSSRTAAAEALKAEQVDVVMTGPAEYVVITKRTGAVPIVGFKRANYSSAIITMTGSDIQTLEDLVGKKVAFGDVGSTSRHLAPMQMFMDAGINPLVDLDYTHLDKNVMHEALKNKDIDAMGQSYESWLGGAYSKEDEETKAKFVVVQQSETLPNDVLVAGTHVNPAIVENIKQAFATQADVLMKALTASEENEKYIDAEFVLDVDDSDYDYVRSMYATAGYPEYAEFIEE